eukprot:GHVL01024905.1.p1 GENE.GHVL01024905.1~~GHVL01024905.1.p1  ORF type:complete len:240 (+),score=21.02 GHVL01024905.1:310-1029(+)
MLFRVMNDSNPISYHILQFLTARQALICRLVSKDIIQSFSLAITPMSIVSSRFSGICDLDNIKQRTISNSFMHPALYFWRFLDSLEVAQEKRNSFMQQIVVVDFRVVWVKKMHSPLSGLPRTIRAELPTMPAGFRLLDFDAFCSLEVALLQPPSGGPPQLWNAGLRYLNCYSNDTRHLQKRASRSLGRQVDMSSISNNSGFYWGQALLPHDLVVNHIYIGVEGEYEMTWLATDSAKIKQ